MRRRSVPFLAFPVVALLLSIATSSVSAELGVANVAIGLAVLTTLAGVINWPTGIATSIVAALSLNYFHTRPVHSLRIGSGSDVLMVALLGGIGVTVSAGTALRTRRTVLQVESSARTESSDSLTAMLAMPTTTTAVWHSAIDAADHALRLTVVSLQGRSDDPPDVPTIARPLRVSPDDFDPRSRVLLPERGAMVDFRDPRLEWRLKVAPRTGAGPLEIDRSALFQMVDAVESVLVRSANGSGPNEAD